MFPSSSYSDLRKIKVGFVLNFSCIQNCKAACVSSHFRRRRSIALPLWVSAGHLGFQGVLFIPMLSILCYKASCMLSARDHINKSMLKNVHVLLSQQTKHQQKKPKKEKKIQALLAQQEWILIYKQKKQKCFFNATKCSRWKNDTWYSFSHQYPLVYHLMFHCLLQSLKKL